MTDRRKLLVVILTFNIVTLLVYFQYSFQNSFKQTNITYETNKPTASKAKEKAIAVIKKKTILIYTVFPYTSASYNFDLPYKIDFRRCFQVTIP